MLEGINMNPGSSFQVQSHGLTDSSEGAHNGVFEVSRPTYTMVTSSKSRLDQSLIRVTEYELLRWQRPTLRQNHEEQVYNIRDIKRSHCGRNLKIAQRYFISYPSPTKLPVI